MLCWTPTGSERGFTLIELLSVLAIASAMLAMAALATGPLIGNESERGTVYEIQSMAQLVRMEAVARNRECLLLFSPELRQLIVSDSQGTTADTSDDEILHRTTLPEKVAFQRPDSGSAVTWESLGGSPEWFRVRFAADGTVDAGEGDVVVHGGDRFGKVSIFTSGATQVSTWSVSGWTTTAF